VCQLVSRRSRQVRRRRGHGGSRTWRSRRTARQGRALRQDDIMDGGAAGMCAIKIDKFAETNFHEW